MFSTNEFDRYFGVSDCYGVADEIQILDSFENNSSYLKTVNIRALVHFQKQRWRAISLSLTGDKLSTFRWYGLPFSGEDESGKCVGPRVESSRLVYKLPLRGTWFVTNGGIAAEDNYHHFMQDQAFAYDLVKLRGSDDDRQTARLGAPDSLAPEPYAESSAFYGFGAEVVAPREGKVLAAVDGYPDDPDPPHSKGHWGNEVILQHASDEYSIMYHLANGSITVHEGEVVHEGEKIAEVGNSGQSGGPHLHWEVAATPFSDNSPRVIRFAPIVVNGILTVDAQPRRGDLVAADAAGRSRESTPSARLSVRQVSKADREKVAVILKTLTSPDRQKFYEKAATTAQQTWFPGFNVGTFYGEECYGKLVNFWLLNSKVDLDGEVSARVLAYYAKAGFRLHRIAFNGERLGDFRTRELPNANESERALDCAAHGAPLRPETDVLPLNLPLSGRWRVLRSDSPVAESFEFLASAFPGEQPGGCSCDAEHDDLAFGRPVLAPGSGEVVRVVDGWFDRRPGENLAPRVAPEGNCIVIKHAPNEFSVLTHLKLRSARVKLGDRVVGGQWIADVGHSGAGLTPGLGWKISETGDPEDSARTGVPLSMDLVDGASIDVAPPHRPKQ